MKLQRIVYHNVNQLKEDFKMWKMFSYPGDFELEMPILTKEEVDHYNHRLHVLAASCGCYLGKIFLVGSIVIYALGFYMGFSPFPTSVHFLNICLFAITGAMVGKGTGLFINNIKIYREISDLNKKIASRRPKRQLRYRETNYAMG
jgi:hypothetical protein